MLCWFVQATKPRDMIGVRAFGYVCMYVRVLSVCMYGKGMMNIGLNRWCIIIQTINGLLKLHQWGKGSLWAISQTFESFLLSENYSSYPSTSSFRHHYDILLFFFFIIQWFLCFLLLHLSVLWVSARLLIWPLIGECNIHLSTYIPHHAINVRGVTCNAIYVMYLT